MRLRATAHAAWHIISYTTWIPSILFSSSSSNDPARTTITEAIRRLRETERMLLEKCDHIEHRVNDETGTARKHGRAGAKRQALAALKRRKRLEMRLIQLDAAHSTVESQRQALENAHTNTEVLDIMRLAGYTMKNVLKGNSVEQVEELMDELAEQHQTLAEVNQALVSPVNGSQSSDDDADLLEELKQLETEVISDKRAAVDKTSLVEAETTSLRMDEPSVKQTTVVPQANAGQLYPPLDGVTIRTIMPPPRAAANKLCLPDTPSDFFDSENSTSSTDMHHNTTNANSERGKLAAPGQDDTRANYRKEDLLSEHQHHAADGGNRKPNSHQKLVTD